MKKSKFKVVIAFNECKGCCRCVNACPLDVLAMGERLNALGFHAAESLKDNCSGCGICYYTCPEPGAITVIRELENET